MELSAADPIAPMLAKAVDEVPEPDSVDGGLELRAEVGRLPRDRRVLPTARRRDRQPRLEAADPLLPRAGRRVRAAACRGRACSTARSSCAPASPAASASTGRRSRSASTPPTAASQQARGRDARPRSSRFDLLARGDESLLDAPVRASAAPPSRRCSRTSTPRSTCRQTTTGCRRSPAAGSSSSRAPASTASSPSRSTRPTQPGKRTMLKIKHHRTADVVLLGYRVHKSGRGRRVAAARALRRRRASCAASAAHPRSSNARRLELIDELAPLVERDDDGEPSPARPSAAGSPASQGRLVS